jgi:hypothetical protein
MAIAAAFRLSMKAGSAVHTRLCVVVTNRFVLAEHASKELRVLANPARRHVREHDAFAARYQSQAEFQILFDAL